MQAKELEVSPKRNKLIKYHLHILALLLLIIVDSLSNYVLQVTLNHVLPSEMHNSTRKRHKKKLSLCNEQF
jgi:hypothetical protein